MCTTFGYYKANEEVFGVKVLDPENSLIPTFLQPIESSAPSKSSLPQKSPDDSTEPLQLRSNHITIKEHVAKCRSRNKPLPDRALPTSYIHQVYEAMRKMLSTSGGEAKEKAVEEVFEKMEVLEKGMRELFPDGAPIIDCKNLGFLDIVMITTFGCYKANEEAFSVKVLDPDKYPLMFSWVQNLSDLPVCKEVIPPHDKLVNLLKSYHFS
ncbi:hypothetical protein Pint_15203 [Pistacia integerrima]|uniref:Uncharacterized protein n=1 Tax=Pistacia integerrima TaxID=434235 RepID=A0ACC0Z9F6_9ROSI|nr:hypothetical protein Pint_15203 [Pistacia integerrima]